VGKQSTANFGGQARRSSSESISVLPPEEISISLPKSLREARPLTPGSDRDRRHVIHVNGQAVLGQSGSQAVFRIEESHHNIPTIGFRPTDWALFGIDAVERKRGRRAVRRRSFESIAEDISDFKDVRRHVVDGAIARRLAKIAAFIVNPIKKSLQ
jgi:hypothetical protein